MQVTFIVGPTASGKTQLSVQLAKVLGESLVVNCDSVQTYDGLQIGSARPTPQEMQSVPHELFGYVPVGESLTAGQYRRDFFSLLQKVKDQYENIFVVGGTGFYFQALEKGMFDAPSAPAEMKDEIERELQTLEGFQKLYQELQAADPEAANRIHKNDHYRLGRAIEVLRITGRPLSQLEKEFQPQTFPFPLKKLGIWATRQDLESVVQQRTEKMLQQGLIQETERYFHLKDWSPLSSVGYKEVMQYLNGEILYQDLSEKISISTLQLAKKQRTWFQRDSQIRWYPMGTSWEQCLDYVKI